eukprot:s638_g8.t1
MDHRDHRDQDVFQALQDAIRTFPVGWTMVKLTLIHTKATVTEEDAALADMPLALWHALPDRLGDYRQCKEAALEDLEQCEAMANFDMPYRPYEAKTRACLPGTGLLGASSAKLTLHLAQLPQTDLIEMKIEGVSFGYRPNEKLLENVGKLHVPLGKIVALVGVHGSGKNTFLRLVSSRLLPDEGEIFVPTHLRVLFVAQDPVLLDAGVWENLTYGAPDNSDLSVVKGVLKMLDMKNILQHLQLAIAALLHHVPCPFV